MQVTIKHNTNLRDAAVYGYRPGDELVSVFQMELPNGDPYEVAEVAYAITNSYPEELWGPARHYPELVAAYRAEKLRSLSIGDVVVLDGADYAVAACGFRRI